MVFALSACSTVKFSTHPNWSAKQGIRAAEELEKAHSPELAKFSRETVELLSRAKKLDSRNANVKACGLFLEAALDARSLLASKRALPSREQAALLGVHNHALARFAELWYAQRARHGASPRIAVEGKPCTIAQAPGSDFRLDFFDKVVACNSLEAKGVVQRSRSGYGASLVGIRLRTPERKEELRFYDRRGMYVATTMVMDAPRRSPDGSGITVPVKLLNPTLHETVELGGRRLPLAANFSAPLEMLLAGRNETLWGLSGFFDAKKRADLSQIYLIEPYDPNRIPVIFVHGLASVPLIWRDLLSDLMSEPEISKRYQFMAFAYPSSYTVAESARLFRRNLAALRAKYDPQGRDPLSNNMVVVGHSMGGVLTHLLVAEIGDELWNQATGAPFAQVKLNPKSREEIRSLVFFQPDCGVKRAVFIATPHRGSEMARLSIAGFVSGLVKLPGNIITSTSDLLQDPAFQKLKRTFGDRLTSIQSLLPDSPVAKALGIVPYKKGVVYHSIIGDRTKGDTPNSSDGVVPYWSSHQNGAASELIVPEDHTGTYKNPKSVAEIKRILRVHAGLKTKLKAPPCPYYKNLGPPKTGQ